MATISSIRSSPSGRCVIKSTVRAAEASSMSSIERSAVSASRCAVGSSSTSTGASESRARARTRRWRCPPESSHPFLADDRVEAVGQSGDPVREARARERGRRAPRPVALGPREQQVRADARVEEMSVLPGERERAADVFLRVLANVAAVDRDSARARIEEAEQQVDDGRLSGAARPDERDVAARARAGGRTPSSDRPLADSRR